MIERLDAIIAIFGKLFLALTLGAACVTVVVLMIVFIVFIWNELWG